MLNYTIDSIFEQGNGKFSLVFGNSAIIDCHYFFEQLIDGAMLFIEKYKDVDERTYWTAKLFLIDIEAYLRLNGLSLCDYTFIMNGVLKD